MESTFNNSFFNKTDKIIRMNMKSFRITGASVAIVDGGNVIFSEGYGFADKANKIKVNSDTIFKIGSITKVFTASAIMQLAEQGKLDIDKPVNDYINNFSIKSRFSDIHPITIRDILCHHSGIPCDDLRNYFSADHEMFKSVTDFLQESYLVYPPGNAFYYSNLGVNLLGVIIEKVSGIPFHQYIDEKLLKGLNMSHSTIKLPVEKSNTISKPYNKGKEQVEGIMKYVPAGGIFSTANDMAKFMNSIIAGGKGLFENESILESMLDSQYPDNPFDFNMNNGLGWFIGKPGLDFAGKVIWHDGGTPNFFSLTVVIPERKIGVTLLTNSTTGALMNHQISVEILQLLLKEKYNILPSEIKMDIPKQQNPESIKKYIGKFITLSGIATVTQSGKKLKAVLPFGTFQLNSDTDDWFRLRLILLEFIPLKIKKLSRIRIGVKTIQNEKILVIEQLGFQTPIGREYRMLKATEHWKELTGEYICASEENPRIKKFRLCNSDDGIFISFSADKLGKLKLYLDIINDSEAVIFGYGRYAGETIFANNNRVQIFGLEFRNEKQYTNAQQMV